MGEGWRPDLPPVIAEDWPLLADLVRECWDPEPSERPAFKDVTTRLADIARRGKGAKRDSADAEDPTTPASKSGTTVAGVVAPLSLVGADIFVCSQEWMAVMARNVATVDSAEIVVLSLIHI